MTKAGAPVNDCLIRLCVCVTGGAIFYGLKELLISLGIFRSAMALNDALCQLVHFILIINIPPCAFEAPARHGTSLINR